MSNFETWWEREGQEFLYALNTTTDDDIKLVAEVAWKNGAYCAEQAEQEPVGDGICLTAMQHPHNCCVLVDDVSEDSIEQVEQAEQEREMNPDEILKLARKAGIIIRNGRLDVKPNVDLLGSLEHFAKLVLWSDALFQSLIAGEFAEATPAATIGTMLIPDATKMACTINVPELAEQEPIGTYKDIANTMNSLWNGTSVQRQIAAELNNKLLYAAPVPTKDLTDTPENGELERLHGYID